MLHKSRIEAGNMADNGTVKPLNHLIVVCCHAIYAGGPKRGFSENEWLATKPSWTRSILSDIACRLIEEFQKGETPTFIKHVRTGLKELAGDPGALLAFSGYVLSITCCNIRPLKLYAI